MQIKKGEKEKEKQEDLFSLVFSLEVLLREYSAQISSWIFKKLIIPIF